jgi:hypothetical protein
MNLFMNQDLQLIVDVQPGDVICVNQKCILPHDAWSTMFWKTYFLESDHYMLIWLEDVIKELLQTIYLQRMTANPSEITITLNRIDQGLANLQKTYCLDAVTHLKLSSLRSLLFQKKKTIRK